jgi:hypothetical protein
VQFAKFKDTSSHLDVPLAPVAWLMAFFAAVTVVVVLRDLVVALQERPA